MTKDWTVESVGASISSSNNNLDLVAKKSGSCSGISAHCLDVKVAPMAHLMPHQMLSQELWRYSSDAYIALVNTSEYNELA